MRELLIWLVGCMVVCGLLLSPTLQTEAAPVVKVTLSTTPQSPIDRDDVTLVLNVSDAAGAPVNGAHVRVYFQRDASGHVHADHNTKAIGMNWSAPIDATPAGQPGVYQAKTTFSQSGKWFLRVTVETPEGLSESAFVLRVQANSGTGDTNLGWIELGVVILALIIAGILTLLYKEERRRTVTSALPSR